MQQLENYILLVPNIVPKTLCNSIIEEYENRNVWTDATVIVSEIDKDIRRCKAVKITHPDIDKDLFTCASKAISAYRDAFSNCNVKQDTGYDLLKYSKDDFYVQHTDSSLENGRSVSCSFALNDDFEGGEFAFFDRGLKYEVPAGAAIMFPSNFMYPHEVMPIVSGTRYSIITWFQ